MDDMRDARPLDFPFDPVYRRIILRRIVLIWAKPNWYRFMKQLFALPLAVATLCGGRESVAYDDCWVPYYRPCVKVHAPVAAPVYSYPYQTYPYHYPGHHHSYPA